MDLIILIILIVLTIVFFRKLSNTVYVICIIDIFLRILDKIESIDISISHCKLYATANVVVLYKN